MICEHSQIVEWSNNKHSGDDCNASFTDIAKMVGAYISKILWDWAQIRLEIVFIDENVQFGTGPILLNKMGPVP